MNSAMPEVQKKAPPTAPDQCTWQLYYKAVELFFALCFESYFWSLRIRQFEVTDFPDIVYVDALCNLHSNSSVVFTVTAFKSIWTINSLLLFAVSPGEGFPQWKPTAIQVIFYTESVPVLVSTFCVKFDWTALFLF